jgi:hypothetical protein
MSWGGIIPWDVLECEHTCKEREPETQNVIHVPECKLGQDVAKRKAREAGEDNAQDR